MDQRRLTTKSSLPALLVDCVASVSVISTRGGCFRPASGVMGMRGGRGEGARRLFVMLAQARGRAGEKWLPRLRPMASVCSLPDRARRTRAPMASRGCLQHPTSTVGRPCPGY